MHKATLTDAGFYLLNVNGHKVCWSALAPTPTLILFECQSISLKVGNKDIDSKSNQSPLISLNIKDFLINDLFKNYSNSAPIHRSGNF